MPGRESIRRPDYDRGYCDAWCGENFEPKSAADESEYLAGYIAGMYDWVTTR
jgi:hypothetical protein